MRRTWRTEVLVVSTHRLYLNLWCISHSSCRKPSVSSFLDEAFAPMPLGRCMICTNACSALSAFRVSLITFDCDFLKLRSSNQLQKVTSCTWLTRSMPAGAVTNPSSFSCFMNPPEMPDSWFFFQGTYPTWSHTTSAHPPTYHQRTTVGIMLVPD